ncbi:MAG: Uma2 family endonuclease [Bryobacteraceae bacterium]
MQRQQYPDCTIERTAAGEILIMPPRGGEASYQNSDLTAQLGNWAKEDGCGRAFDSSTDFPLPNNAARSPDAAWVSRSRLDRLAKERKRKFIRLCPKFVVDLRSPSDRLNRLQSKMQEWIDNGTEIGWLIDPERVAGEDPLPDLFWIWAIFGRACK